MVFSKIKPGLSGKQATPFLLRYFPCIFCDLLMADFDEGEGTRAQLVTCEMSLRREEENINATVDTHCILITSKLTGV